MTLVKYLYSGDPDVIMICMTVGAIRVKSHKVRDTATILNLSKYKPLIASS
jgi:hypothetical protein